MDRVSETIQLNNLAVKGLNNLYCLECICNLPGVLTGLVVDSEVFDSTKPSNSSRFQFKSRDPYYINQNQYHSPNYVLLLTFDRPYPGVWKCDNDLYILITFGY